MQNRNRQIPIILLVILALLITASCAKKTVTTTKDPNYGSNQSADSSRQSIKQSDLEQSQGISTTDSGKRVMMVMLEDIYFEFDKSTLTPQAKETLMKKAEWLRTNKDVSVIIEGHCDERGTNEYNLALGDRRAAYLGGDLINQGKKLGGFSPSQLYAFQSQVRGVRPAPIQGDQAYHHRYKSRQRPHSFDDGVQQNCQQPAPQCRSQEQRWRAKDQKHQRVQAPEQPPPGMLEQPEGPAIGLGRPFCLGLILFDARKHGWREPTVNFITIDE